MSKKGVNRAAQRRRRDQKRNTGGQVTPMGKVAPKGPPRGFKVRNGDRRLHEVGMEKNARQP